jgi:hypothetical protein
MSDCIRNAYFNVIDRGELMVSIMWVVYKVCLTNKGIILGKVA